MESDTRFFDFKFFHESVSPDTGDKTVATMLKGTLSKKSLYECKQQPCSISTKYERTFCLKIFIFITGVVDTGD